MAGHTKGPWVFHNGYAAHADGSGFLQPVKTTSPWVAGAWKGDEEAAANDRLMASAESLLEAAKHARMCVPYPSAAHAKLDAAIKQAEGEA